MDNIKLETELKLEVLFLSVTKDTISSLSDIEQIKEIDINEKTMIRKFVYMTGELGYVPNVETLKKEFPSLYFDGVEPISKDELDDYIRLYISNRKNLATSRKLLELANYVKTNGVTEDIVNQLNVLTKSDSVKIAHKDMGDNILEYYEKKIPMNGIKTGVKRIDEDTGGLHPGTLTTILGFTGSFKTTWALNIAYNAITEGKNVLYLSLEVIQENIYYNLLSRHSFNDCYKHHIEHLDLKHKKVEDLPYRYLKSKIVPEFQELEGKIFVVDETELEAYSFYSLETKFREIEKLAVEKTGHGIDLLVVDHAQLLKFDASMKGIGNETNVVNAYVSFFRQEVLNWIKSGKQIAGLMLSQSSREGWKEAVRAEGRYRLTALAEANELERASSLVLSVFSSDSLKQVKAAKIQILKNRDGQAWSEPAEVFVDPAYCAFGELKGSIEANPNFDVQNMESLFAMDNDSLEDLSTLAKESLEDIDLSV